MVVINEIYCTLQRLATRESGVKIVPVIDAFLAKVPTQVDFAAIAETEEIDKPAVRVFQFAAEAREFFGQPAQSLSLHRQIPLQAHHALVQMMTIACCLQTQSIEFLLGLQE